LKQLAGAACSSWWFLAWLASGFYIVVESQRGGLPRKFSEVTNPGLRAAPLSDPEPRRSPTGGVRTIEVAYRNNVKTKVLKESLMLTDDENIVDIQMRFNTRSGREGFLFNNVSPECGAAGRRNGFARVVARANGPGAESGPGRCREGLPIMQEILTAKDRHPHQQCEISKRAPPEQVQAAFYRGRRIRSRAPQERGQSVFQ